jgi:hypothetical protein
MTEAEAIQQLTAAAGRVCGATRVEKIAAYAYLQATLAQAANQALINLLKQHNVVSDGELSRHLARAYEDRFKQLSGANGAILTPAPQVRPQ